MLLGKRSMKIYKLVSFSKKEKLIGLFDCLLLAKVLAINIVLREDHNYYNFIISEHELNEIDFVQDPIFIVKKVFMHDCLQIFEELKGGGLAGISTNIIPQWLLPKGMIFGTPIGIVADKYDDLEKPLLANAIRNTYK
jgi:hypothetical protein